MELRVHGCYVGLLVGASTGKFRLGIIGAFAVEDFPATSRARVENKIRLNVFVRGNIVSRGKCTRGRTTRRVFTSSRRQELGDLGEPHLTTSSALEFCLALSKGSGNNDTPSREMKYTVKYEHKVRYSSLF